MSDQAPSVPTNCRAPLACWQGRQGEPMPFLSAQPDLAIIVTVTIINYRHCDNK